VADRDTLHAVYSHLFRLCPLSPAHRTRLRPLDDQQLARYGTLPADRGARRRILDQLIDKHGFATLLKVPGFVLNEQKELDIRGAGIVLPARDVQGRIVAVDVRREQAQDGRSKYYKLSSRHEEDDGAPSPGAPAHVARPAGSVTDTSTVYATEGTKKADVLADRTGCVAISIPGIGNTRAALQPLEELASDVLVIALDQDDPENHAAVQAVARAREELAQAATELGYAVRIAQWDPGEGKGVDDLLLASKTFTVGRFTTTTINGEAGRLRTRTQLLGEITEVLHNWSLKPATKVCHATLLLRIHEAQQDPRKRPDAQGRYEIPIHTIAHEAKISRNLAGTTVRELADDHGFFDVTEYRDRETGKKVTLIGLGPRRLGRWDKLPEPAHLARERQRKRCPHCGSGSLEASTYVCRSCKRPCTADEAKATTSAQLRTESVHGSTGEVGTKKVRKQCTESVHGGIHAGHLTQWLETNFVRVSSARTPADELRANYHRWCRTTHEEPCPWQVVEAWLSESGAHLHHGDRGPVWLGIGLHADDVTAPPEVRDSDTISDQEHAGCDDGVVVDLAARRAEREEVQQEALPIDGLSAGETSADSPLFKCSECRKPINKTYGLCAPCRSAVYAREGEEEWR
jgi:hypothetical protein